MIKTLALIAVAAIGALLIFAATRPDTFRVQRSASIKAAPDRLYPLINDLRQFNTWNPYEKKDPAIKGSYRGPASGPGAGYDFQGNKDVGKGRIEIIESSPPGKVTMKLDMLEPFEGRNVVEFSLAPRGEATEVTWAMHGPSPFVAKLVGVFLNMDRMIGRDFEAGLANLKARAERA
ncbi:SRPBCC family protein [Polaromonas sp. P1(28)-8]|nr:SRPBCC family protein [Polaromonas sp. P1(28)-8]